MFDFTQITLVIGKCNKNTHAIDMLGTGFLISNEGKVVTARHVVGNETNDLCVLSYSEYKCLSRRNRLIMSSCHCYY